MPLPAACASFTVRILRPEARRFSVALGLICLSSPAFVNNLYHLQTNTRIWGLASATELARELYFKRERSEEAKPCRNPSKPATFLNAETLGHILGLALTSASETKVQSVLKSQGIETNRVQGKWTGISLARYKKLIGLVAQSVNDSPSTPAIPLLTRLVWENCDTKRDLLSFYRAVHQHVPIIDDKYMDEPNTFLGAQFSPSQLTDEAALEAASLALVQQPCSTEIFASALELVSASLSQSQAFKPAWKIQHHSYKTGKVVPDCVEVVCRELVDLLIFNRDISSLDVSRLPASSLPGLKAFYQTPKDAKNGSNEWFLLCQEIPSCEYISSTPNDGLKFELFPSLSNVIHCVSHLLGRPDWAQDGIRSFCKGYNSLGLSNDALIMDERREMYRAPLSEESRRREIATMRFSDSPHYLELTLEGAHRLATVKHCRLGHGSWVQRTRTVHQQHWANANIGRADSPLASIFWPSFLQDNMLLSPTSAEPCSEALAAQAILSARWGSDRRRWALDKATLVAESTEAELRAAHRLSEQLAWAALSTVLRKPNLANAILPWLLQELPDTLDPIRLASMLHKQRQALSDSTLDALERYPHAIVGQCVRGNLANLTWRDRLRFEFNVLLDR